MRPGEAQTLSSENPGLFWKESERNSYEETSPDPVQESSKLSSSGQSAQKTELQSETVLCVKRDLACGRASYDHRERQERLKKL